MLPELTDQASAHCELTHNVIARHVTQDEPDKVENGCLSRGVNAHNAQDILGVDSRPARKLSHVGDVALLIARNAISCDEIELEPLVLE